MKLEDLEIYQLSMEIGENIWKIMDAWDYSVKDTVGKQLIRSADSIAANISEGFGRYHYKDSKRFYYISRGSLFETKTWLEKSQKRKLITEEIYDSLIKELNRTAVKLNNFIKSIGDK